MVEPGFTGRGLSGQLHVTVCGETVNFKDQWVTVKHLRQAMWQRANGRRWQASLQGNRAPLQKQARP